MATHTHTHVGFYGLRGLSIGVMVFILYKLYVLLPYTYPTPKLSPHRRRCISTFPPKNAHCMIYKRFKLWGHWKCPHKSPSPCNTHVIIQICVLINHINMHTHTHTHTHVQLCPCGSTGYMEVDWDWTLPSFLCAPFSCFSSHLWCSRSPAFPLLCEVTVWIKWVFSSQGPGSEAGNPKICPTYGWINLKYFGFNMILNQY